MIQNDMPELAPAEPTSILSEETFEGLGMATDLADLLAKDGITEPFPIQTLTIPDALAGRDICGRAKTGSGKTLAFGLPLIERLSTQDPQSSGRGRHGRQRNPRGLVLVPTRELAVQVSTALTPLARIRGLKLVPVYGGAAMDRQIKAVRAGADLIVATPGRMIDLMDRRVLDVAHVEMVVLDEADQMADLGFLPQVNRILPRIERQYQTLLFSATLDGMVEALVRRYMHEPVYHEAASAVATIETMQHRFVAVHPTDRVKAAAAVCSNAERVLVFVRTKRGADRLAKQLVREGIAAGPIHGDLRQSQRERTLRSFGQGKLHVLVATNVAARGLHVDGVDLVLHFDAPEDHKTYVHRSGRTARAGEAGLVVTFVTMERFSDVKQMQEMAGLDHQIIPMRSDDPRLTDLGSWDPPPPAEPTNGRTGRRSRMRRSAIGGGRRRSRR